MIVFFGQGGLGNQLFQYAAARRLAEKTGQDLVLDAHWFENPRKGETPRALELKKYPLSFRMATGSEQKRWRLIRGRFGSKLSFLCNLTLLKEQGITVDTRVLNSTGSCYLLGYWQSEKYFNDIRGVLIDELKPLIPPSSEDDVVMALMSDSNSVSLHVRRGDYVSLQSAASYHGVCSLSYYNKAVLHMKEQLGDGLKFFVFSDDPDWVKENLNLDADVVYVSHNSPDDAFQDLRLMSACKHHILANSSFSWWGAWLGEWRDGLVIAPSRWYVSGKETPDLLPKEWLKIDA
ncbi:alpha-1,2-fucosyltransferase [Pseudomonas tohonis]|uniref:alpha-1,2-fucosyltransferase n=1 Tax=Pseudomonas tohonis TaxID=2725477 RepID=UPI0021DABA6F|nr:alpha-1,2-fucosyltransferase [Pseudomonas tohonis]UXY52069.1 alpha-1,2-fucosyltransferase [Pseudomonas tohonis]